MSTATVRRPRKGRQTKSRATKAKGEKLAKAKAPVSTPPVTPRRDPSLPSPLQGKGLILCLVRDWMSIADGLTERMILAHLDYSLTPDAEGNVPAGRAAIEYAGHLWYRASYGFTAKWLRLFCGGRKHRPATDRVRVAVGRLVKLGYLVKLVKVAGDESIGGPVLLRIDYAAVEAAWDALLRLRAANGQI